MIKGLKALKKIKTSFNTNCLWAQESCNVIEKELKALEIIKEKQVDVALFVKSKSVVDYNGLRMIMFRKQAERDYSGVLLKYGLNQEEWNLLRGVLINE